MSQITRTFEVLKQSGRAALMPYMTMGYPQLESALDLVPVIAEAGADLVELGVPFSDPLADGPTIQASSQKALENGMSLALCLKQAAMLRARGATIPFVLMGYYNPIVQFGIERFAEQAAASGIDGIIVPDLPPEEANTLHAAVSAYGLDFIFLLAPTSDAARVQTIAEKSGGFIYLVSLVGVTGARDNLPPDLTDFVTRVRRATHKPLAVGFGIATPEQTAQVAQIADGVIVGSALIKAMSVAADPVAAARTFVAALRTGVETQVWRKQLQQVQNDLEEFEQRYAMTSADFYQRYQAGQTNDRMDYVEWASLVQIATNLKERLGIARV